ncbi:Glycosyltransferase involved in cell wall bisynthesis [Plantibacter flavus]|uniref:Glycosyltransferase involved in cell wall biosynthesis n=1 Tax=Plantibacter flavus TaxID=150123 RepID=A0A3N2BZU2_9MICO|nr:glycosyl transferase [Plantibacter flavus]ROR80761.1 glycosyltransferase involved in cell wall biosynthesis [Plantibacter flavus]SMG31432.1 Glycosyltransferase involved in cell wall bisynthesis [Plantibacter flavus]
MTHARAITVQQSFPEPRPTTNPYIVMLRDHLATTPGLAVRTFSWRGAILGRYDVFHAHWPEILVSGGSAPKRAVRQALTLVLLAKLALTRTPIVRTLHNLHRPTGISRVQHALLWLFERRTAYAIVLNEQTVPPAGIGSAVIPHGHYRDWYARFPQRASVSGRLSYFGLIRRYKGVDGLLRAFTRLQGPERSLRVAGRPSSEELADELRELAIADDRIDLSLEFLSDAELVDVARQGELVVLPYREMHNSGGALAALSVDRPVLVPANAVNERLAAEVGPGWVVQYEGELDADDLERALAVVADPARSDSPDLSARDWDLAGALHLAAYRAASSRSRPAGGIDAI